MADGERVFHPLPKFPAVTRDLALVCDEAVTVGALEACITASAGKLLRRIDLFDIYRGPGIEAGKRASRSVWSCAPMTGRSQTMIRSAW